MKNCGMRIAKCGLAAMLIAALGCTRTGGNGGATNAAGPTAKKGDPWPAASAELMRQPDVIAARRALNQLNSELDAINQPLPVMSPEEIAKLTAQLHPSPAEAKDWAAKAFTPMDANYLGECLFFAAVARSLDVKDLPPEAQAKAAFDWTCRQIYLRPSAVSGPGGPMVMPPLPPQEALRRGYGSGYEREAAFLALARQLGLEGVLVGPPGAETKRRTAINSDNTTGRGPFWAVGVRSDNDVLLFDPWLGEAIPGPEGTGIARLSAAKANPATVTKWLEAKKTPPAVNASDISASLAYSTAPQNAVTPRMKVLEANLTAEASVKLAVKPTAPCYAPPLEVDPYAVPHVLGTFTPKDDGGYDATPAGPQQLAFLVTYTDSVAAVRLVQTEDLTIKQARAHFLERCASIYKAQFMDRGLRDRIQRGQFNEAVRQLVEMDRDFTAYREQRRDPAVTSELKKWYKAAAEAYEKLQLSLLPENAWQKPEAEAAVQRLWDRNSPILVAVQMAVAEIGEHETAYLMALCKHEQAERSQTRWRKSGSEAAAAKAAADWAVAKDAWARYLDAAERFDAVHPGRREHAKKLSERASALAANPQQEGR